MPAELSQQGLCAASWKKTLVDLVPVMRTFKFMSTTMFSYRLPPFVQAVPVAAVSADELDFMFQAAAVPGAALRLG
jgi:hypothetical protein